MKRKESVKNEISCTRLPAVTKNIGIDRKFTLVASKYQAEELHPVPLYSLSTPKFPNMINS